MGFFRECDIERRPRALSAAKRMPQEELRRRKLVRRSHFLKIIAAWVVTVPVAALMSGLIFTILHMTFVS